MNNTDTILPIAGWQMRMTTFSNKFYNKTFTTKGGIKFYILLINLN